MEPPRHYSVSPLPSFCTVSATRPPPLSTSFLDILRLFFPGLRPHSTVRLSALDDAIVDRLVEDEAEEQAAEPESQS
jgi:hypothetical protein